MKTSGDQWHQTLKVPLILLSVLLFSFTAKARDRLGIVDVEEVFLKPTFEINEPQETEFDIFDSSASLSWRKSTSLSGKLRIGSLRLRNTPQQFVDDKDLDEGLGIFEAYAQYQGVYGKVRAGLIPIEYAVTGTFSESQLLLPRSLLFQKRVIGLRDVGISYHIHHNGFYTKVAVHNGEAGENIDKRMFLTSSWGWQNYRNINVGFSGQTGTTKPEATLNSTAGLAGVDSNEEAKWRTGTFFVHWYPNAWNILLEATLGELDQLKETEKYSSIHFDLTYKFNKRIGLMTRYDSFDPNGGVENDREVNASVGLSFHGDDDNSIFYVLGTKKWEEGLSVANDQLLFVWQITPLTQK